MPALSRHTLIAGARAATADFYGAQVAVRHWLFGGPRPLRLLLVSDGLAYTSEQQFAPLARHAAALRRELGVVVRHVPLQRGLSMRRTDLEAVDLLGLKMSFLTPVEEANRVARYFRDALAGTSTRLVYFDGDDDLCIQWPEVLSSVDAYVKKHVFSDTSAYQKSYLGKSNLTDYVARLHGRSFEDNPIPAAGPVPEFEMSKLFVGWNIGLDDKISDLIGSLPGLDQASKDVDVVSRAFVKEDAWIYPLRGPLVERIEAMDGRFKVLAPRERVSQDQYYAEMLRARICVSPFGYGELCWRDFEAVLCGCMVVKPEMAHLRTCPDIFVAGETYAPVKWDYSDLADVCALYLADDQARLKIANRARAVLMEALGETSFIRAFRSLLSSLGLPAQQR